MADRFFSDKLGGSKDSDITEAASTTAADFVEIRIDETQSTSLNDIFIAIERLKSYMAKDKRYA
jgi:hypothetical protein